MSNSPVTTTHYDTFTRSRKNSNTWDRIYRQQSKEVAINNLSIELSEPNAKREDWQVVKVDTVTVVSIVDLEELIGKR